MAALGIESSRAKALRSELDRAAPIAIIEAIHRRKQGGRARIGAANCSDRVSEAATIGS